MLYIGTIQGRMLNSPTKGDLETMEVTTKSTMVSVKISLAKTTLDLLSMRQRQVLVLFNTGGEEKICHSLGLNFFEAQKAVIDLKAAIKRIGGQKKIKDEGLTIAQPASAFSKEKAKSVPSKRLGPKGPRIPSTYRTNRYL